MDGSDGNISRLSQLDCLHCIVFRGEVNFAVTCEKSKDVHICNYCKEEDRRRRLNSTLTADKMAFPLPF